MVLTHPILTLENANVAGRRRERKNALPLPFEAFLSKQLIFRQNPNLEVVRSSPDLELSFPYNIVGFGEVRELGFSKLLKKKKFIFKFFR